MYVCMCVRDRVSESVENVRTSRLGGRRAVMGGEGEDVKVGKGEGNGTEKEKTFF